MRPGGDGKIANKMKAPKDHRPLLTLDVKAVMRTFIEQQHRLLNLLEQAKGKDIGRIRTPISISRFVTLKAGDTFRFLIAHQQRHFVQISDTIRILNTEHGRRNIEEIRVLNTEHYR